MYVGIIIAVLIGLVCFVFDTALVIYIQNLHTPILNELFIFLSEIYVVGGATCILSLFLLRKKLQKNIIPLWVSAGLSYAIIHLIKSIVLRPRPFITLGFEPLMRATSYSFPSGHAGFVFAVIPFLPRWQIWTIFAILVAFSRVFVGVHYPSDVIFGAIIGYSVGLIVKWRWKKWSPRWK